MMSIREVADYLNVSTKTVYRMISRGELKALKVSARWRLRPEELEVFLKGRLHDVTR